MLLSLDGYMVIGYNETSYKYLVQVSYKYLCLSVQNSALVCLSI